MIRDHGGASTTSEPQRGGSSLPGGRIVRKSVRWFLVAVCVGLVYVTAYLIGLAAKSHFLDEPANYLLMNLLSVGVVVSAIAAFIDISRDKAAAAYMARLDAIQTAAEGRTQAGYDPHADERLVEMIVKALAERLSAEMSSYDRGYADGFAKAPMKALSAVPK